MSDNLKLIEAIQEVLERAADDYGIVDSKGQWLTKPDGSICTGRRRALLAWIENQKQYTDEPYTVKELPQG